MSENGDILGDEDKIAMIPFRSIIPSVTKDQTERSGTDAAPSTSRPEGRRLAFRCVLHQGPQSAVSDICKVAAPDALKRHNRPFPDFDRGIACCAAASPKQTLTGRRSI